MGDIADNFSRSEFACKCGCGFDTVDAVTLEVLKNIRRHFDAPVTITSGCRCESYNKTVGGKKSSQHLKGRAADIQVEGHAPLTVKEYAEYLIPNHGGVGLYNTFVHIDTRTGKARWEG